MQPSTPEAARTPNGPRAALAFVVLIGIVSLFADATYEGARSLLGPYMLVLGASATAVGIISGFGELVGACFPDGSAIRPDATGPLPSSAISSR